MKRFLFVSLALVGMMAAAPCAQAALLLPGGGPVAPDTFSLSGLTLVDTFGSMPLPLSAPGGGVTQTIFGTYQEWVYTNGTTLTFVEQVNLANPSDSVDNITVSSYAGFTTDVGYVTGSGGVAPASVQRSTDGTTVGFTFLPVITAGNSSALLVVQTDATSYNRSGVVSVIDSTTSSNQTFQPTQLASVPEPSSFVLAGIGALGMIGYGLRRRKASAK